MSNRKKAYTLRLNQATRRARIKSRDHGTVTRLRRERLLALRRQNIAAGQRHMLLLEQQLREGVIVKEKAVRREKVLVRANPHKAAAMAEARARMMIEFEQQR